MTSYWRSANGFECFEEVDPPQGEHQQTNGRDTKKWEKPKPLPDSLAPVAPFRSDFMPAALAPWIDDIANRLQCPPDYVGIAAITSLGSVIGRRVGIKPQMQTDWIEVANIWGGFIGRPGMLKSPAMMEALRPLHHLEAEAAKENEVAVEAYKAGLSDYKVRKQVKASLEKTELRKTKSRDIDVGFDLGDEPKEPALIRYRTNDTSYEALGVLLVANPAGLLIERDELVSLLRHLDQEEQAVARGFYLSGWSGTHPYTFDRIARGHLHIDAVCLSVLGTTQPARIGEYIRRANLGGAGGDGLIQRFGLLVWPDVSPTWTNVDQYPDPAARERAWQVYERASKIDTRAAREMGALKGPRDKIPYFRFDEAALADFLDWRSGLERRLRSGELSAAIEGHLAKYRGLVPALALINHIADHGGDTVGQESLGRALAFASYLETHSRRIYGAAQAVEVTAAKAILGRIRRGDLRNGFTARDIQRMDWAHLSEREHIGAGLSLLVDLDHLAPDDIEPSPKGGRRRTIYHINPAIGEFQ